MIWLRGLPSIWALSVLVLEGYRPCTPVLYPDDIAANQADHNLRNDRVASAADLRALFREDADGGAPAAFAMAGYKTEVSFSTNAIPALKQRRCVECVQLPDD